jgi:predicted lipid-binding transport protein (Tim44 family)
MRSRISALSLSSLTLAGAIFLAIIFVRPIPKASAAAPQNNSAAKQSTQADTKTETKSDAKPAGKSSPAQAPAASGSIEGWVRVVAALSPTRAQRAFVNRTLSF